ncbi:MAG TPA: DUF2235 domain-containing protein [Allosphingosinicella sp.]
MQQGQTPETLAQGEPAGDAKPQSKSIILFSDGTGNSSAKLFKTNVWRMYEAVDLGVNAEGLPRQIAYYDNGVGTEAIKALAMLAGIFGFGLKRNVLRIYRFVCRNYEADDSIYGFGFSRGAYTIRLVAAMLATQGVVQYESEAELKARSLDAFRRFQRESNPAYYHLLGCGARLLRDGWIKVKRFLFGPRLGREKPPLPVRIRFLGVWDTVAAYGGPITEITRGIDMVIYPLSMPDTYLNEKVEVVRHALAIDDERDAFHPVLWDEVDWHAKAMKAHPHDGEARKRFKDRLKQVWFSGMHADVGGGYPDESLSYVSLCWMMGEAKGKGLRLIPELEKRVHDLSNSLGPIHDSRAGLASYYRYQPRRIGAYLHQDSGQDYVAETLSMRDPQLGKEQTGAGALLSCKVHESVVARVAAGTDDYAPVTLPNGFEIEPFSAGQTAGGHPVVEKAVQQRLSLFDADWKQAERRIFDMVWIRRGLYFATTIISLIFLLSPIWAASFAYPRDADNRWMSSRLTGWSDYLLPDLLNPWVHAFETTPLVFGILLIVVLPIFWTAGTLQQGKIKTEMRALWKARCNGTPVQVPGGGGFAALRRVRIYQQLLRALKWAILPFVFGILLLAALLYLVVILWTQVALSVNERTWCAPTPVQAKEAGRVARFEFKTREKCNDSTLVVQKNHRYQVTFRVQGDWMDGQVRATPAGLKPGKLGIAGFIGIPLRRVVDAPYLAPIYQIRPVQRSPERVPRVVMRTLLLLGEDGKEAWPCRLYHGSFEARETGRLYMFANDAAVFGNAEPFYTGANGNSGMAQVMVRDIDALPDAGTDNILKCDPPAK